MRVVFMGTPEFAVPSLEALSAEHDVVLVVTRPDAIRGRGRVPAPSAVKRAAAALSLPVAEAGRVTPELVEAVATLAPDIVAVAAYGALLPDALLAVAPHGAVNVHASLLPRWRGAAPIQRAVLAGDARVGVSIMRIVHELDAGPYCRQASVSAAGRGAAELTGELAALGACELLAALADIACGTAAWTEQNATDVTYAHKLTKAELRLAPADDAATNARRVLAATDAAPARAVVGEGGVRVLDARVAEGTDHSDNVEVGRVRLVGARVLLGCANATALELVRVRPDGRRDMDAAAWARGLRDRALTWAEA